MNKNFIIAFEGLDGTGKTKFSNLLKQALEENNISTIIWKIDSHSRITLRQKNSPLLSFKYYIKSIKNRINNNSRKNNIIIFDRYLYTALGYRTLRNNERITFLLNYELRKLHKILIKPEIVFLCKTTEELRKKNIYQKKNIDFLDIDSLNKKNINFWNNFYTFIDNKNFYSLDTSLHESKVLENMLLIVKEHYNN